MKNKKIFITGATGFVGSYLTRYLVQSGYTNIVAMKRSTSRMDLVAEVVDKLHAICVMCGAPASRNQRLIEGRPAPYNSPIVMIGAGDSYEARCRACHVVPRRDDHQQVLL